MLKKILFITLVLVLVVGLGIIFWIKSEDHTKDIFVNFADLNFGQDEISGNVLLANPTQNQLDLTVTSIAVSQKKDLPIYYYLDNNYPVLAGNMGTYYGTLDFVSSYLAKKGYDRTIQTVSATELPALFERGPSILFACSGVLPETVYSRDKNLLTPWLKDGGRLFWVGDGLGYYSGVKGEQIVSADSPAKIGWEGQKKIFGQNMIDGYFVEITDSVGLLKSRFVDALGLRYHFTRTGALLSALAANSGVSLGFEQSVAKDIRSSASVIPVGDGKVILFGSGVIDKQREIGWDISQILVSGVLDSDYQSMDTKTISLKPGETQTVKINMQNNQYPYAKVMVFSNQDDVNYFYQHLFSSTSGD